MPKYFTPSLFCDCGNAAIRLTSNREPICLRCSELERTQQFAIRQSVRSGVTDNERRIGSSIRVEEMWENYYSDLMPPKMGESLKVLEMKLQHAA